MHRSNCEQLESVKYTLDCIRSEAKPFISIWPRAKSHYNRHCDRRDANKSYEYSSQLHRNKQKLTSPFFELGTIGLRSGLTLKIGVVNLAMPQEYSKPKRSFSTTLSKFQKATMKRLRTKQEIKLKRKLVPMFDLLPPQQEVYHIKAYSSRRNTTLKPFSFCKN